MLNPIYHHTMHYVHIYIYICLYVVVYVCTIYTHRIIPPQMGETGWNRGKAMVWQLAFCFVAYDMLWTQYKVGILATATKDKDIFGKKTGDSDTQSDFGDITNLDYHRPMEIRRNSKIEGILSIAMMGNFSLVVACTGTKGPGIDQDEGCWFDSVTRMPWDVPGTSGRCWSCWSIKNLCTSQWETRLAYNSIGHLYNLYPFLRFKIWSKNTKCPPGVKAATFCPSLLHIWGSTLVPATPSDIVPWRFVAVSLGNWRRRLFCPVPKWIQMVESHGNVFPICS